MKITSVAAGGRHTLALSGNSFGIQCTNSSRRSWLFVVVTVYSFVGSMKYEDMEGF